MKFLEEKNERGGGEEGRRKGGGGGEGEREWGEREKLYS